MSNTYNAIFNGKRCLLEVESDGSCEYCTLRNICSYDITEDKVTDTLTLEGESGNILLDSCCNMLGSKTYILRVKYGKPYDKIASISLSEIENEFCIEYCSFYEKDNESLKTCKNISEEKCPLSFIFKKMK